MEPTKKRIDIIREKCEANGLQIHKVFRIAGVSASTIRNWTYSEPQAFQIEEKINQTIELLISEGENESELQNKMSFNSIVQHIEPAVPVEFIEDNSAIHTVAPTQRRRS